MANTTTSRSRALLQLMRADTVRWAALGILLALRAGLAIAGPIIVRRIIDLADAGATAAQITRLGVLFLVIALVAQALGIVVAWYATTIAWRTTNDLRMRMTRHVLGLDHEFHRSHTPGELIQRVDGDVTAVSDFLGRVISRAVGAVMLVFAMVVALAFVDLRLALGAAVYIALAGALVARSRHRAVRESSDEMGSYANLYGGIEERLTAAEDLRANGAGQHVMWRFVNDSARVLRSSVKRESAFLKMWWIVEGLVACGSIISLLASALLISANVITLGTGFLLFQYVQLLSRPLEDMVQHLEIVQKANGAMSRVVALLNIQSEILDLGTTSPSAGPMSIEFEHVGFDYGDDETVLNDVNLTIQAGRSVGIIGRSGSGKTTMSRLVLRLVETTKGAVFLGSVPIADIPLVQLRKRVALVPQEVELFSGSVRDNVTLFDDTVPTAAVEQALRHVGLNHLLEGGIDRDLGSTDAGLSAGEAQLLALARVWLRQPDVMVLDEATARVDPQTEQMLEAAITALMHGRTTLIIAHRLSTLKHVDDVLVVESGKVVEFGPRDALEVDATSHFHRLLSLAGDLDGTLGSIDKLSVAP